MLPIVFVVPGRLETRTGGYEYDRKMIAGLRQRGWTVHVRELEGEFPLPTPAALSEAARVLAAVPDGTVVVVDGLALGAMPDAIETESDRLRIVGIVHLPLAAEIGLDPQTASRLAANEARALAKTRFVVVTGNATVKALTELGVRQERIDVIEPGTDRAPLARGSAAPRIELLSVAALSPGKGHDVLLRALGKVRHLDWHLTCAGGMSRSKAVAEGLLAWVKAHSLADRVSFVGELAGEALAQCYDRADLFVLATLHETYGMAVAEALARGLPVVATATGAIPALVSSEDGASGCRPAGLLVPPGDVDALAAALAQALGDTALRQSLAEGARLVRERLPDWDVAVGRMATVLERVANE
jgi:glycosyltransferase involved in cell wall biosynthesis